MRTMGFFGDDEDVNGGVGLDVAEGEDEVVFIDDIRRNLAGDDFFKSVMAREGTFCLPCASFHTMRAH